MKNRISVLLLLTAFISALSMFSCEPDPEVGPDGENPENTTISVTGISLNYSEAALFDYGEQQLTATIEPADAENTNIIWSSSDTSIVTVSETGLVTAAGGVGSAVVTAASEDGGFTADCCLYVHQLKFAEYPATDDYYGDAIAITDDFLFVGAAGADHSSTVQRTGAVFIYQRNEGGDNTWGFVKKITSVVPPATVPSAGQQFGKSLAAEGDILIVGAYGDNSYTGAVYIFYRNQGGTDNWGQVKKITASDAEASDYFGVRVSMSGNYALVGAYGYDGSANSTSSSGAAYVLGKNEGGTDNWGEIAILEASTPVANHHLGLSISISGAYAAMGDFYAGDAGEVYVYFRDKNGPDRWGSVATLSPGAAADGGYHFGESVCLSGDDLLVGATGDTEAADDSGAAYFFRNQGGTDNWGLVTKITASDGAEDDYFGWPCSISGDYAVVSAYQADVDGEADAGAAYVYYRNEGGAENWGQVEKLSAAEPAESDYFGMFALIADGFALIGVSDDDDGVEEDTGSMYMFSIY